MQMPRRARSPLLVTVSGAGFSSTAVSFEVPPPKVRNRGTFNR